MKIILPDQSIKLPEPLQRSTAEQFLESAKLGPEIIKTPESSLDYWKNQLAEMPTLDLPTDKPRPALPSYQTKAQPFALTPGMTESIKTLSRREGVTVFVTLATALQVLLHRCTGQDDIALGTPSSGRSGSKAEGLSASLPATLVLRTNLAGNPRFRALLTQVREVTLGAYTHQEMPWQKWTEIFNPQRHPLCPVLFTLQNSLDAPQPSNEALTDFLPGEAAHFDLAFTFSETLHDLTGTVRYATDLFEAATIERLISHFQTLLEGIVADPAARLSELPTIIGLATYTESQPSAVEHLPAMRRYQGSELPSLSFAQTRMWLLERISGPSDAYNIPFFLKLEGALADEHALECAINEIICRHDSLRTYFIEQEGVPIQVIRPLLPVVLVKSDLSHVPEAIREAEMERHFQVQASTPFDLDAPPLLRVKLIRLADKQHVLLLTFHHIISDGWSMNVFARELSALYGAFSQGLPSPLPELPIQYTDYALWQREWLHGETLERLLAYWMPQLANISTLELPTDKPRPPMQSFRGATVQFSLPSDLSEALKTLSRREGATVFMTLLAAFQVVLHRHSGQDDIVIGTPIAGRSRVELENLIGFFANTLLLRTDLSGNPSFRELLARVCETSREAYAHQDMPFEKLVEMLNPQRDLSRNPLFQVRFAFRNSPDEPLQFNEVIAERLPVDAGITPFDLSLELSETRYGLTGTVEYATDLFESETISRLIGHFQTLLEGIVADPEARLSELPLLTDYERRQLLVDWNDTAAPFPADQCIHELFEAQVAATPHAIAVVYENRHLTYAELNAHANRLAHYLRELGVKPDTLVAICVERGLTMIVGLLAILKAGGAYLPLDPAYPEDRLAFMLEDSEPLVLLTQGNLKSLFADIAKTLPVIDLKAESPVWANRPDRNPDRHSVGLTFKHLAYLIYTSGSTGKPKGVMIEHQGLCSMITDLKKRYQMGTEDRMLQFATIAFDVSVEEIFTTLLSGSGLVIRTDDWLCDASKFWALCQNNGVSIVNLPTLFWQQLAQENQAVIPTTVRQIIIGGDAVSSKVLADWFGREGYRPKLLNAYGPTETTVNATIHEPSANALSWQSIGRPIANTFIYILDANHQPVPIGVAGELFIGGAGIARGYLKRPELTAERFIADPFSAKAEARIYKTGDLARWLADGTIEFLGRNDFQVKIRGFRIELGDIETKLAEHPAVREVAVLTYEDNGADKRLVAYLVPQSTAVPSISELREFLKPKLPEFMMPSAFVFLDALPLTPNGKLDRKALPKPDANCRIPDAEFMAPRNPLEQQLTDIWAHVLKLERIGIHDNFFALGGHSLLAVKMVAEVNKQLNTDLVLGVIYRAPTIEELGLIIASGTQQPFWYSVVPIQMQGSRPPLFAIHTITLLDLPRHLGQDQPLYFLRYGMAAESNDHPVSLPSLKDLARHYISEMQLVQPEGPYYLIGFSFGGMIAYEMAQQLSASGHQVNLLGLLDTHLTEEQQRLPLTRIIRKFLSQGPRELMKKAKTKINDRMTRGQYGTDFWPHVYTSAPDTTCGDGYQADVYPGRVTLFQAFEQETLFFTLAPPEHEWKKLLGDRLDVESVPGQHFYMCREPHVQTLAAKIIGCMDQVMNDG